MYMNNTFHVKYGKTRFGYRPKCRGKPMCFKSMFVEIWLRLYFVLILCETYNWVASKQKGQESGALIYLYFLSHHIISYKIIIVENK